MTTDRDAAVIVVPCFNEAHRIDERAFGEIVATGKVRLLFVDDGSTDDTSEILHRMARTSEGIDIFALGTNTGKAEAVRRGLLVAVRGGAGVVGYYDADLATPPAELLRLTHELTSRPELSGVLASRVARLGSSIERNALRHYLGRAYATIASTALGITVYDTQCGAKVFRVNDTFVAALADPFRSSWAFDVELLDRLLHGNGRVPGLAVTTFLELPLAAWHDVTGSKVRLGPALAMLFDLVPIARRRARRGPVDVDSGSRSGSASGAIAMAPRRSPDGRSTSGPPSGRQAGKQAGSTGGDGA